MVLGTVAGIFVIDSYTFQIDCIINHNIILNKIPKKIEFVSPFDIALEMNAGGSSFLVALENYSNVRPLGIVPSKRVNYERSFSPKVLEIDWERKIVILVEQGCFLQFMNMDLELIN